ncbi:hypothetical protein N0V90_008082 [Kalmusia sp. IMI 367209]|nr:hypothetical protein N0V90_008082 [Kalmusia sp. IMI 367209]
MTALTNSPLIERIDQGLAGQNLINDVTSTVVDRIWVHNQKVQLSKALTGLIQTLCAPRPPPGPATEGEILEEYGDLDTIGRRNKDLYLEESPLFSSNKLYSPRQKGGLNDTLSCGHDDLDKINQSPSPDVTMGKTKHGQGLFSSCSSSSFAISGATYISHDSYDGVVGEESLFQCEDPTETRIVNVYPAQCSDKRAEIPDDTMVSPLADDEEFLLSS